jgi:thiol-disulfide isomerase/thioredoxin
MCCLTFPRLSSLRCAVLAALCLGLLLPSSDLSAQPAENPGLTLPGAPPREANTPPEFKAGATPAELLEALDSSWQTPIDAENELQEQQLKIQILNHIIGGSDQLMAHEKSSEEQVLEAVQHKMQALGILARAGDPQAAVKAMAMANDLASDKRPLVAREGKLILISSRLNELESMETEARKKFTEELSELLGSAELTEREVQIANITATLLERAGDVKAAEQLFQKLAEMLKKAKAPNLRAQADEFAGAARRLGLPGNTMKLTGETLDGEKFDLKDLKGKVVLVQFWASWCTYCVQEMPHIMKNYHLYHDKGFEVIGVNLDEQASRAQEVVKELKLPWPNLFSRELESLGAQNPNAVYYGITSLPQCILIDREGKVVTLTARGKVLDEELEKLFSEK